MIETADLLDMERELSRRGFMRRMFAIGAGIAASGALVRAADAMASLGPKRLYELTVDPAGQLAIATVEDLSQMLKRVYSDPFRQSIVADSELMAMFQSHMRDHEAAVARDRRAIIGYFEVMPNVTEVRVGQMVDYYPAAP